MAPGTIIGGLWIMFAASWLIAAMWSSSPAERLALGDEMPSRFMLVIGGLIFLIPRGYDGWLWLWNPNRELFWACIIFLLLGFAFAWWARITMGRLWSGRITRKVDHRIIDTGPFGIVRHPIYTGILLAVLGTLLVKGTALGVLGATLIVVGLWTKAKLEERWLTSELGQDYQAYRQKVPMLVPFGPR